MSAENPTVELKAASWQGTGLLPIGKGTYTAWSGTAAYPGWQHRDGKSLSTVRGSCDPETWICPWPIPV